MKSIKKRKRKNKKNVINDAPVVRYQTDKDHGLSEEQINERKEHHLTNDTKIKTSNSYLAIIAKNTFTIFNCIWLLIAVALMCVNAWGDLLFLFVVFANTVISIFQEIKAKNTVEKLSMVSAPKIKVVRTGLVMEIKSEDLLLDDIVLLENGNQIPADCIIVDGTAEANESLLTGESNSIKKQVGDSLLAGSFLVSGQCYARVDKVGKDNYIQTVAERTKDFKVQTSNLFKDLNSLIKIILLILIPVGVLTFCKEFYMTGSTIEEAIKNTSGALTGMIPAGMYLLITVGLSVGVIKLGRKKTLVKNLYSIEMLARANILCLDKTGTITDGTMNVVEVVPQNDYTMAYIERVTKIVLANQKTTNSTSVALIQKFGKNVNETAKNVIEFSSQRKYSATTLTNGKTYYIGAPTFIKCHISAQQKKTMESFMDKGYRVIAFVEDNNSYNEKTAGKNGKLVAFFVLEDHIRKDAVETIEWFKENNVKIKIISGDDALTVSKIAKRVGVEDSDKFISLEGMSLQDVTQIANKFTVFGRVTPEQKHTIIKALKTQGNTVAMTGDGVNDTLALKEANCSIAMADGSEVARNISHLVLMESNFSALPSIVCEGRKIVNNVQHSSVLYLMKTIFTILLCVTTLILKISYPFTPKQLLLLEMFVIGLPSFILTFQPNKELIRGNFIPQVLKKSIPSALLMFVNILIVVILNENTVTLSPSEYTSLCTMLLTFVGFINLVWLCMPFTWLRASCVLVSATFIIAAICCLGKFFSITDFTVPVIITLITLLLCTILFLVAIYYTREAIKRKKAAKMAAAPATVVEAENADDENSAVNEIWNKINSKLTPNDNLTPEEKAKLKEEKKKLKLEKKLKKTEQVDSAQTPEEKIEAPVEEKPAIAVEEKSSEKKEPKNTKSKKAKEEYQLTISDILKTSENKTEKPKKTSKK